MTVRAVLLRGVSLALAAAAAPASAQVDYEALQPSETQAIVAAAQDCLAATSPARVDEERLIANGWVRVVATGDNASREKSRHELARGQMILWLTQKGVACIAMGRLRDSAQFDGVTEALIGVLGQPTARKPDGGMLWLQPSGAGLEASRTGSRDKPAIRLFIMPATG